MGLTCQKPSFYPAPSLPSALYSRRSLRWASTGQSCTEGLATSQCLNVPADCGHQNGNGDSLPPLPCPHNHTEYSKLKVSQAEVPGNRAYSLTHLRIAHPTTAAWMLKRPLKAGTKALSLRESGAGS
ncbi:hypothetical protein VULLAG_LOCUS8447 [Vulpes lagopus]